MQDEAKPETELDLLPWPGLLACLHDATYVSTHPYESILVSYSYLYSYYFSIVFLLFHVTAFPPVDRILGFLSASRFDPWGTEFPSTA